MRSWTGIIIVETVSPAPALPDAVDVEVAVPGAEPVMLVSKVELPAATILAVEPIPPTVTLLSVSFALVVALVASLVVKVPLMVPSEVEDDSVL